MLLAVNHGDYTVSVQTVTTLSVSSRRVVRMQQSDRLRVLLCIYHIMRYQCTSDMKQTVLERQCHKLSSHTKNNFDPYPLPPFAIMPHMYDF